VTQSEFAKRAYTKEDIESLIKSRWNETFVNMKDIDEAKKEFEALLPKKDGYGWDIGDPFILPTELEKAIKRWFGGRQPKK